MTGDPKLFAAVRQWVLRSLSQIDSKTNRMIELHCQRLAEIGELESAQENFLGGLARRARVACELEVTAPKLGNVHPAAGFADMSFEDFFRSAELFEAALNSHHPGDCGQTILRSVEFRMQSVLANTNLGIILLLVPLVDAAIESWSQIVSAGNASAKISAWQVGIERSMRNLKGEDGMMVYQAIRLASPGGLGNADSMDVQHTHDVDLVEAMRFAANRDLIARQYSTHFTLCFEIAQQLLKCVEEFLQSNTEDQNGSPVWRWIDWLCGIVVVQLQQLSQVPDTLIARKLGIEEAERVRQQAQSISGSLESIQAFDASLRGHRNCRNPGAIADILCGSIFVALVLAWHCENGAPPPGI